MAEITVAASAGFCFGVDRAVKLCYQALEQHHHIATLGPIIHNQNVVDDLTSRGRASWIPLQICSRKSAWLSALTVSAQVCMKSWNRPETLM